MMFISGFAACLLIMACRKLYQARVEIVRDLDPYIRDTKATLKESCIEVKRGFASLATLLLVLIFFVPMGIGLIVESCVGGNEDLR